MTSYMRLIDPLNIMGTHGGGGQAKMPKIATPSVGDPDTTPGQTNNPALANAASQQVLSSTNTVNGKLLGG